VEVSTARQENFDITTLRGKPVVIYVWGKWCIACERSTPAMNQLASQHPEIRFLYINTDAPAKPLKSDTPLPDNIIDAFLSPAFFDEKTLRRKRFRFSELGLVFGVPAYFVLDAEGRITTTGNGGRYPEELATILQNRQ
jgi:thiol-disulfide isomerase/thioredoxin